METVRQPVAYIIYNGKNVTEDVSECLLSVTYNDKSHGESDEVELEFENVDQLWSGPWYPTKGDKISVEIGYLGDVIIPCGVFQIDEIEIKGPPDTVSLKGLSTGIKSAFRTKNSSGYENLTLKQIAEKIANKHGLGLIDNTNGVVTNSTYTTVAYSNRLYALLARVDGILATGSGAIVSTSTLSAMCSLMPDINAGLADVSADLKAAGMFQAAQYVDIARLQNIATTPVDPYDADKHQYPRGTVPAQVELRTNVNIAVSAIRSAGQTIVLATSTELALTKITRITQHRQTDLDFLKKLSDTYGFQFTIKGDKMVFISMYELEKAKPVQSIDRSEMASFSFKDKTANSYKAAQVTYHNPVDKKVVNYKTTELTNADGVKYTEVTKEDTLVIRSKVENPKQAEQRAKAELYRVNSKQQEGDFSIEGNPLLVAGNNIDITGLGSISGKFQILESTHKIERGSGYSTDCKVKRVGFLSSGSGKTQQPKTPAPYKAGK